MFKTILTSPQLSVAYASEELRACRACLTTDTKLYSVHDRRLARPFEELTGTPVSTMDGLPQHICSVCCAQVWKFAAFRAKCRKAHFMLQDARVQTPMITTVDIRKLDTINLQLHLTKTETLTLDYAPRTNPESPVENEVQNDDDIELPAKVEVPDDDDVHFVSYDDNSIETYCVEMSDNEHDIKAINDFVTDQWTKEEIKVEETKIGCDTFYSQKNSVHSNEEMENVKELKFQCILEPLELEKKGKDVSEIKKKGVKRKRTESEDIKSHNTLKHENTKQAEQVNVIKKKRKRRGKMYNLKTEEDFVEFCKLHNVDVKICTKDEQIKMWPERKKCEKYQKARFKCEFCFTGFVMESAFSKHMKCHDPSRGSLVCEVCQMRFPNKVRYQAHCRLHTKLFICKLCNHETKSSYAAKTHHKWHEGIKYECKECGKFFVRCSSYMNHRREKHSPYACDLCQETIAGEIGLAKHKVLKHAQKCATCNTMFDTAAALARHRDTAFEDCTMQRSCFVCGENFPGNDALRAHQREHHPDKLLQCDQCDATFTSDRKRWVHGYQVHRGRGDTPRGRAGAQGCRERSKAQGCRENSKAQGCRDYTNDFVCEVCANSYRNATQLRYHQRTHTDERPYPCAECGKRFRDKHGLRVHINTHTGERPFKCRVCPETFKSYSQRHKHKLLKHTLERRCKCHLCDKAYVVSSDLNMHLRTFHMNLPYPPRKRPRRRNNKTNQ